MNLPSLTNSQGEPEVMMDINTTPLIDVMLVLLIMLIITIPVQLHSVNLDMPQSHTRCNSPARPNPTTSFCRSTRKAKRCLLYTSPSPRDCS